ncbi:glycerate kinase [Weissella confusa]|uniref:glycerate kinase n=1 Tax=Weissella confusa TaxID=1583 RepID=UPI00223BE04C|nr:glycerate kinase [Weissella confusa]MCT0006012.1 glycerate kinase [Weissella confusa]MCT0019749.1 glycerate kinase [Weissella confusa]MCT0040816.1 glycerate kinase [Weissella confusa]
MKFVIAPDSFKESMTAKEATVAIQAGLQKIFPDAKYELVPMADGGEGTVQSLVDATNGQLITTDVQNPLDETVSAFYGVLGDQQTAVIEMSAASGIQFVTTETKNPLITTTYGTGQLIKDALDRGMRRFIIGLGGSATNDGGAGMAEALGVQFLDENGQQIARGGAALATLHEIDMSNLDPRVAESEFLLASDVTNPLVGETGASAVFGPQKGATPAMVAELDAALTNYAAVIKAQLGVDLANTPGAGAAGGSGAGMLAFTQAKMQSGISLVVEATEVVAKAANADVAFVGEGAIDFQTQYGKTPMGAAQAIKQASPNAKVIGLAGYVGDGIDALYDLGIDAVFSIVPGAVDLPTAMKTGEANLTRTAENIARLLNTK